MTETNLVDLLTAAGVLFTSIGVLLANYWLYKLNGKFDHLSGRVDAIEKTQNAHVNAPGLHALGITDRHR